MGKNLKKVDLVKRTGKIAFYGVGSSISSIFQRMEGFTDLTTSKNAKEYSRQYVDEDYERSDVIAYNSSISYNFDAYKDNSVLEDMRRIHEEELTGTDAVREIISVDMTTVTQGSGRYYATGYRRQYAVVPDSDGGSTDCLTYSGAFKSHGEMEIVQVYSATSDFQSITAGAPSDIPVLNTMTLTGITLTSPTTFSSSNCYYQGTASSATPSIAVTAKNGVKLSYSVNGVAVDNLQNINIKSGTNVVVITLVSDELSSNYQLVITKS